MEFEPITMIRGNMPPFVIFKPYFYKIEPKMKEHIGEFMIEGTLVNKHRAARSFRIRIRVTNTSPKFLT